MDLTIREEAAWHVLGVLGHPSNGKGAKLYPQDHSAARQEGVPPLDHGYRLPWRGQTLEDPGSLVKGEDNRRWGGDPGFLDEMHRDLAIQHPFRDESSHGSVAEGVRTAIGPLIS